MNLLAKSIAPTKLTSAQVLLNNALLSVSRRIAFNSYESPLTLRSGPDGNNNAAYWITIRNALGEITIGLGSVVLQSLVNTVEDLETLNGVEDICRFLILIEIGADAWITELEKVCGSDISITSLNLKAPPLMDNQHVLNYRVFCAGTEVESLQLRCSVALLEPLCRVMDIMVSNTKFTYRKNDASIPVLAWLGSTEISRQNVTALEAGDVLIFTAQGRSSVDEVLIKVGTRHKLLGTYHRDGIRIIYDEEERLMVEEENGEEAIEPVGSMAVRLDFDVGCSEITINELQHLTEGYVLRINRSSIAPVNIRCGPRIIGTGELVEIDGEQLAVRLVSVSL